MNYLEEITLREQILSNAREGKKITPEDRLWLLTHKMYNQQLGYPFLNNDIIQLNPKTTYYIQISIEQNLYPMRILPVISVPGGKGEITANELYDYNSSSKKVKALGLILNPQHSVTAVQYQSDLGLLGVSFQCDYYDHKLQLITRKDSSSGDPHYAMIAEKISENKIRYRCKMPNMDSFDAFVFIIEWK